MSGDYTNRDTCRICGSKNLLKFLELGPTPLANRFLSELSEEEPYYPLDVYYCNDCGLVQLLDIVPSEDIFNEDYAYFTGASEPMCRHFSELVDDAQRHLALPSDSLIVDVGCNDGTLLKCFSEKTSAKLLGIDPAVNVVSRVQKGINVVPEFFGAECALKLSKEYGKADIITAINVLAHTDDLNGFVKGVSHFLHDDGLFIVEVPYLKNLIRNMEFDTCYHEHYSYFALRSLIALFKNHGMSIMDIEEVPVHGGSLRLFVRKGEVESKAIRDIVLHEFKLDVVDTYLDFNLNVKALRRQLTLLLKTFKDNGKRITGYGASAKGNTLLNYCKIGTDTLDYITDTTPFKQGKYTPGMHIPIYPVDKFYEDPPDYALILAWNYADEIIEKEKEYIDQGGKFIVPIPVPKVIG